MVTAQELTRSAVGAACAELARQEEDRATDALVHTDPTRWSTLEWIDWPGRITGAGAWPRSIACRWEPG